MTIPLPDDNTGAVVALAGRRIDHVGSIERRFPFSYVRAVRAEILLKLQNARAEAVVCSAACGADLLALDAASELDIRARIVLPFQADRFREISVVDRPVPEFWGSLFDRVIARAKLAEDLVELGCPLSDREEAFSSTNRAIVAECKALADASDTCAPIALVVWEGSARGDDDATGEFVDLARTAGFCVEEVNSLLQNQRRAYSSPVRPR